jgi:hypothetical protein
MMAAGIMRATVVAVGLGLGLSLVSSNACGQETSKLNISAGTGAKGTAYADAHGNIHTFVFVSVTDEHGAGVNGLGDKNFEVFGYGCGGGNPQEPCASIPLKVENSWDAADGPQGNYYVDVFLDEPRHRAANMIYESGKQLMLVRVVQRAAVSEHGRPGPITAQGQVIFDYIRP